MKSILIKLIDKNNPDAVAAARSVLTHAGYSIQYEGEAKLIGVDATKHGSGEQIYGPAIVLVGAK